MSRMSLPIPPRPLAWERWGWFAIAALLIMWSYTIGDGTFFDIVSTEGMRQVGLFVGKFWPPNTEARFLRLTAWSAVETLAISVAGTVLSVLIAGGATYFAASDEIAGTGGEWESASKTRAALRRGLLVASRSALNFFRTVPELVWAIFFVFVVGLGPFAGVLALGLHNGGVLGKLYAEAIENVRGTPQEALRAGGAGRAEAFVYAALPQAWPQLIAYTLYRWEVSIRAAAILGFVGAGGLGQQVHIAISLFLESRLATLTLAVFLLVNAVDLLSGWLRRRLDAAF